MTTAQAVQMSVTVNNNSPIQDYVHPDDQTQPTFESIVFHFVLTENTKTEYDKSKEKELLQEMLEVVEKREQLISDVEDTKKRLKILVDSLCKTMIKVLKTSFCRNVVCTFGWCSLC